MSASPRGLAGAKDAELAARRVREEAVDVQSIVHDISAGSDDDDDDEEEVTTRVYEVELANGASPWATAFLECASEGDLVTLTKLLDEGKVEINDVDVDGFTAVMIAAAEAQNDVAMELLRRGADVGIRTHEMRSTALHFAAKSGAAQVVEAICQHDPQRVDAQNLDGDTPLIWACTEGRADAVRVLIKYHANVNAVGHRGMSALICAVMMREDDDSDDDQSDGEDVAATDADRAEIVRMLLTKNPKLVNYQDRDGSTAMHLAASHGYLQCVKTLLEFGADITLRNAIGQTPLEEAEETGVACKSGDCIAHLRMVWKKLEEEASARMMAMLEMEDLSLSQASTGPRSAKKANKKKQKKAKQRRGSKPTTGGSTPVEKAPEDKGEVSSGEGSSDEESDHNEKKVDGRDPVETAFVSSQSTPEESISATTGDVVHSEEHDADQPQDGGVWTTVGRKHNQYLSQKAVEAGSSERPDQVTSASVVQAEALEPNVATKVAPVSPRSNVSQSANLAIRAQSETKSDVIKSSEKSAVKTMLDGYAAHSKQKSTNPVAVSPTVEGGSIPFVSAPQLVPAAPTAAPPIRDHVPAPPLVPAAPTAASSIQEPHVNSPFSTFRRLHNTSRLYERYERSPQAATETFSRSRFASSGFDSTNSSSIWRTSPTPRMSTPSFTLDSGNLAQSATTSSHGDVRTPSMAGMWRYTTPSTYQSYDRGSLYSSKKHQMNDRIEYRPQHAAPDLLLRSLCCGLCGELVNDNLQCNNNKEGTQCLQLYCSACLARAGTNASPCVKCGLFIYLPDMKRNDFAEAQATATALLSRTTNIRHQDPDMYGHMRLLMRRVSDRVQVADVDPYYLVPGANLGTLSVGQLDALEEVHLAALQQITQARVENARQLERLRMEEWLKTQRDVFQFASTTSSP